MVLEIKRELDRKLTKPNRNVLNLRLSDILIMLDKERVEKYKKEAVSKQAIKNDDNIIKYLEKLSYESDDNGNIEIEMIDNGHVIKEEPIGLKFDRLHKIDASNYMIMSEGDKYTEIDLKNIADIVAFDFVHRELDIEDKDIDNVLCADSLTVINDSENLLSYIKEQEENMYIMAKGFRVSNSPYYDIENKKIKDYFYSEDFKASIYQEALENSMAKISRLIAKEIQKINSKAKMVMCDAEMIGFISTETINIPDIVLSVFGRRYIVPMDIEEV